MIWQIVSVALAIAVTILLVKQFKIKKSLRDVSGQLHEIIREDTNTSVTLNMHDSALCQFAGELNRELRVLRFEKLQLRNSNNKLQNAVVSIAHDLRTPLTSISGYLELLEEENFDEKSSRYIGIIRERTDSLKKLTEELFSYSVAVDTFDSSETETVSIGDELEIALAAAYQTLTARDISPEITLPETPVKRNLDRKDVQRLFGNILNNAAKYSDGDLTVTLRSDGMVTFCNAASSLSEVEVRKMFDRFYTVDNAKNSTGLGLAIAKLLVEKMNSNITAYYKDGKFYLEILFGSTTVQ